MFFVVKQDLKKNHLLEDAAMRKAAKARAWKALQVHVVGLRKQEVCRQMRRGVPLWKGGALKKIKSVTASEESKVWDPGGIVIAAVNHFEAKWECDNIDALNDLHVMLLNHEGLGSAV